MNVAVKFWSDVENPKGVPGEWPAEVREIGEQREYTKEPGNWTVMSVEQYKELLAERRPIKEAFDVLNPEPAIEQPKSVEERLAELEARLVALEKS